MKWLNLTEDEKKFAVDMWGLNFEYVQAFWTWHDRGLLPDGRYDYNRSPKRKASDSGTPKSPNRGW